MHQFLLDTFLFKTVESTRPFVTLYATLATLKATIITVDTSSTGIRRMFFKDDRHIN